MGAAGILAACNEASGPANTAASNLLGAPVPATTLDSAELKICKFGSAGTFTVTVDGVVSQVTLQDGDCQLVGSIPPLAAGNHSFTVAENSDPATVFDSIEVFHTVNKVNVVYETSGLTPSFSSTFNGDVGRLVEFFNHPAPPPPEGCTFTFGFWKNHPSAWPSGFDPNATFGLSGQTWIGVLKTAPLGNAYYILAHQYIAAVLNGASGASAPANVQSAMSGAAAFFAASGPSPAPSGAQRTQLITWANLLDDYNNGLVGPGHCAS
jgi:hypothetical protein